MSVGIFLSGSGARVTFHAGVVDALRELGVGIDQFVGASGGSIHSVLTVCGCPGKIWFDRNIPVSRDGMRLRPPILKETLDFLINPEIVKQYGGVLNLNEINKRVSILATERYLKPVVLNHCRSLEELRLKLLASSSLPYFTTFPVVVEGKRYADGFFSYFYRRLDFSAILKTSLKIASLALPTPYRSDRQDSHTNIFVIKQGKFSPLNITRIRHDDARRFYEDGFEQVMKSRIHEYLPPCTN